MQRAAKTTALLLLLAGFTLQLPADRNAAIADTRARALGEQIAEDLWERYRLPYLGLAVVRRGQTVLLLGKGQQNVAQGIAFDPRRTVFRAASVAKLPTTLVAAELLLERGIEVDEPVQRHIRSFSIPTHERTPIRFSHLFTHTEGFEARSVNTKTLEPDELIPLRRFLRETPPRTFYRPGMMISYGNWASAVLGGAIEELTGRTFAEAMAERLFRPAGMLDTTFEQPLPSELAGRRAHDYRYFGPQLRPLESSWSQLVAAGGMHTTVADMARLMAILQAGGGLDGAQILSQQTVQRALETQFRVNERLPGATFGFLEEEIEGLRVLIRDGDSEGKLSRMILVPAADIGLFLVSGSDNRAPRETALHMLAGEICAAIECADYAPAAAAPAVTTDMLRPYAGLYSIAQRPRRDVSRLPIQAGTLLRVSVTRSGTLLVSPTMAEPLGNLDRPTEFLPLGDRLFEALDRPVRIAFDRGPRGEVRYMFSGSGYHGSYEKLFPWQRLYFALAGLVAPILLCAVESVRRLIAALRRGHRESDRRIRLQRIGLAVFAASITAFAAMLIPAIVLVGLTLGLPAWALGLGGFAYAVFTLPLIGLAAVLFTLGVGARSVSTGVAIAVPPDIMDRVLLGVAPILFAALYHWRLLGFWF